MARIKVTPQDKQALKQWQELIASIKRSSSINPLDTPEVIRARRERLEQDHEAWFRYYFELYCTADFAPFHKAATKRFFSRARLYDVRAWSRELSKTGITMMQVVKAALTGVVRNVMYISNSADNAIRLLLPIKANLEANQRILQDYGAQETLGQWEDKEFVARCGCAFRAIGAGQSPRGTRHENLRLDCIVIDDIDTDEECKSPNARKRFGEKWKWIEEATIPAMSVSGDYRIIFNGNLIHREGTIARAITKAKTIPKVGHWEIINIRDERGRSSWAAKNSEEDIDDFLALISYAAGQREFFNNPIAEGDIFGDMLWAECPPLDKLDALIVYADPAPANSKSTAASHKAITLLGMLKGVLYVYRCRLDHALNSKFIGRFFDFRDWVWERNRSIVLRYYIECNGLQKPFHDQVFVPLLGEIGSERGYIAVREDNRDKRNKYDRIEGHLQPLYEQGKLIFNIEERDCPHMQRLAEQFRLVTREMSAPADGPDCVEGGWWILNGIVKVPEAGSIGIGRRVRSNKRY